jgi:imidazolonepropionase-like amidohydrolase
VGRSRIDLTRIVLFLCTVSLSVAGCERNRPDVVRVQGPRIALTHVELIDGTGTAAKQDQTIVIENDRIAWVGPADDAKMPPDVQVLDLSGHTVLPGLVGMHNHLFYAVDGGTRYIGVPRAFAHLYLAAGVTSLRTAGSIDLQWDSTLKHDIDAGREIGPRIHLSSPYIRRYADPAMLRRDIGAFADAGVTSLKIYTDLPREQLALAIAAARARGLTVTGHLCAVGFTEAAALGIDNLEHGLIVDTEFHSKKVPDQCPEWAETLKDLLAMHVTSQPIQDMITALIRHRVAVTSTLAVFESFARATTDSRVETVLTLGLLEKYRDYVKQQSADARSLATWEKVLKLEMAFERSFVERGGMLLAGADPTGWGGVLAGFADHRNIELLVEAGFTIEQAIQIASANGAAFLGDTQTGTVAPGKLADLAVCRGSLASDVRNVRNVAIVFKSGVGYDSAKLIDIERGRVGATE